jgi:hypothetical protein
MSAVLPVLIIIALLATLGVLLFGVFSMARGGESNKLMRLRVICQFVAIMLIALLMLIGGKG